MPRGRRQGRSESYFTRQWEKSDFPVRYVPRAREEVVIRVIMLLFAGQRTANVGIDDMASKIIEKLWKIGGFSWELAEIRAYVRGAIRHELKRYLSRKDMPECEFVGDNPYDFWGVIAARPASQEMVIHAQDAVRLLNALPADQARALSILADGGSPIDVAEEMGLTPWEAIHRIKEARANIHRVDPM